MSPECRSLTGALILSLLFSAPAFALTDEQLLASEKSIFAIANSVALADPVTPQPGIYWRHDIDDRLPDLPPERTRRAEFGIGLQGFSVHSNGGGNDTIGFFTLTGGVEIVRGLSLNFEGGLAPGTYRDNLPRHRDHDNENFEEDDNDDDDNGTSLRLRAEQGIGLLRLDVLRTNRLALYVDAGIGGLHASHSFPTVGHEDNWLIAAGGGARWRLGGQAYAVAGARIARLSGGDLFAPLGRGSDGVQYYGGFEFAW